MHVRSSKPCTTGTRRLTLISLVWLICLTELTLGDRKRVIKGTGGVYCAGPVLKQTEAPSATQCATECSSDAQCVAYSQRAGSQCLLHVDFCASTDLSAEPGSFYAGKWNFVNMCSCIFHYLDRNGNNKATIIPEVSSFVKPFDTWFKYWATKS